MDKHGEMNTEESPLSKNLNQIWMTLTPKTYLSWISKKKNSSMVLLISNRLSINWKNYWITMMPGLPLHTNRQMLNSKDCIRHISYQDSLLWIGWQASQHLQNVIIEQNNSDLLTISNHGRWLSKDTLAGWVDPKLHKSCPLFGILHYYFPFPLKFKWNN